MVLGRRFFAVVAPFATVQDDIGLAVLRSRWRGETGPPIYAEESAAAWLAPVLGEPANIVAEKDLLATLAEQPGALAILPFDHLSPVYKALTIDGVNILSNRLDPADWPLVAAVTLQGPDVAILGDLPDLQEAITPATNRDPDRLTTLIMTGVTAMARGTAEKMEQKGYTYPAAVISDTLRAADITHVSNEVPFIQGCQVNNTYMNLILCSDYPYWQALEAIGVDIVGLSGNHVNDFGREGARESLQFYRDKGVPVYGSGLNEEEACRPLRLEHNGNSFAFIAALAWWPEEAWATATEPGACYFYRNYEKIFDMVRQLSREVDVVSVELQYVETYDPWPTRDQVEEFRALHEAGADIVTGVQSHVPQAMEPYGEDEPGGSGIIVYGLGNLFFDQMQSWETRTGLIARHTIYDGRLLSTEILTTVLEDFAQPRWATPEERAGILETIFAAAPEKGRLPPPPTPEPTPTPISGGEGTAMQAAPPVPASETPIADAARPGPSWPAPEPQPQDHFWLVRPTAPDANRLASSNYGFASTAGGRYRVHHGVDIMNPTGTPLFAPDDATVVYAGPDQEPHVFGPYPDFYGNVVLFRLNRAWRDEPVYVLYGHMNTVTVQSGQPVRLGDPVGTVGMTGIAIGPHVHVEVRLGGTDYTDAYNSELWLEPLPGHGVIAGQAVTSDGRAWINGRVFVYRLDGERRLYRIIPLYADDAGIHPDPGWAENFLLADVPEGDYELVLRLDDRQFKQKLHVSAGRTNYARFVVD
ncbi:MAG: hypothetical protein D6775_07765 [Caldilineae bacterium]|nr:MAG: hypothetical protein D6775_07765 [Caldilineae bacterium]